MKSPARLASEDDVRIFDDGNHIDSNPKEGV